MINIITGNIIDLAENGKLDYIVQGCNCFHTMGSGLAGQLVKRYPLVLDADKTTVYGDPKKLGTWTSAKVLKNNNQFTIVNAYTQYFFGLGTDVFEYDRFDQFLENFGNHLKEKYTTNKKIRVGFPKIGAGLAGGDWTRIVRLIGKFAENNVEFLDVTVVYYSNDL